MQSSNILSIFILISAITHLAVLMSPSIHQAKVPLNEQGSSGLPIEIHKPNKIYKPKPTNTIKQTKNNRKNSTQLKATNNSNPKNHALNHKKSLNKINKARTPNNTDIKSTSKLIAHKAANSAQVATILKHELTKYFYYPKLAQRRNWQGDVIVEFVIRPSGVISNIKIKESSGYSILDNAAIISVKKINQPEKLSLALNGNHLEQTLPIKYKLIN